jgi:hypothetical protein
VLGRTLAQRRPPGQWLRRPRCAWRVTIQDQLALRRDIDAGNTRDCQTAIEDLSDSFIELEESDVPANYVVRLRQEQAGLRKAALRIYHIQCEEFLPSGYAMIVSFVIMILILLLLPRSRVRLRPW